MFCDKCGTELPDGAQFCASCGNQLESKISIKDNSQNGPVQKKANKKLIIILSICLGVLLLLGGGLVAYGAVTGKIFGGGETSASEQNSDKDWEAAKAAYLKKISSYQFPSNCKYIFIDIDGDDILELYMLGPDYATGDMLWTYHEGNVSELKVPNYGLSYFEGENYFMSKQMHMGFGWDNVFIIEDGEFVSQHYGEWSEADPYTGTKDKHIFDGESMDKNTYESELNSVFDDERAKHLSSNDPGWMTIEQLKKMLSGA